MAGEGSSQAEVALGAPERTGADLVIGGPEKQVHNPRPSVAVRNLAQNLAGSATG